MRLAIAVPSIMEAIVAELERVRCVTRRVKKVAVREYRADSGTADPLTPTEEKSLKAVEDRKEKVRRRR